MWERLLVLTVAVGLSSLTDYAAGHGMTTFQCPNGYYLSRFGSAYDGTERFYKFACSRFSSSMLIFDEKCSTTETASTENGDMYLSCGSDQYTVGIEMIENVAPGVNSWQLLCCNSESIRIRTADCIDTKFINDYRRASTFSSSAQIIRRWQAMAENGDRRWWLQLCPVDVEIKKPSQESEIRARRQVPWQWSRGRYPPVIEDYNPLFLEQERREELRRHRLFEENNRVQVFPGSYIKPKLVAVPQFIPYGGSDDSQPTTVYKTRLDQLKDMATRRKFVGAAEVLTPSTTTTTISTTTIITRTTTERPPSSTSSSSSSQSMSTTSKRPPRSSTEKHTGALDYYDMYDENFDKEKHTGPTGFLNGISDFLQNIQDGLSMAQIAFPQATTKKNSHQATTPEPAFKIDSSSDDDSLTIDMKGRGLNGHAFIQSGPMPDVPKDGKKKKSLSIPNMEGGTIENMLQMLGLCKGH